VHGSEIGKDVMDPFQVGRGNRDVYFLDKKGLHAVWLRE
jgi:hypothetical protein